MWSVIYLRGGEEFQVRDWLAERGQEVYVPFGQSQRKNRRHKQPTYHITPTFPNYAFIKDPINWNVVRIAPGFMYVLKPAGNYLTVPDVVVQSIKDLQCSGKFDYVEQTARILFEVGDEIYVVGGPMSGLRGRINQEARRMDAPVEIEVDGRRLKIPVAFLAKRDDNATRTS